MFLQNNLDQPQAPVAGESSSFPGHELLDALDDLKSAVRAIERLAYGLTNPFPTHAIAILRSVNARLSDLMRQ